MYKQVALSFNLVTHIERTFNMSTEQIENTASTAAAALRGKVTRATHLKVGTTYIMRAWHNTPVYSEVVFVGFGKSIDALNETIPQLKSITGEDHFYFTSGDEQVVADGRKPGALFIGADDDAVRVTFSALLGAEAEVAVAEPVAPKAKRVRKAKAVVEAPAETVEA
jgi:hypothetical protein